MTIMMSLEGIGSFALYFGLAVVAEIVFVLLYMAVTTHHEASLIRQGNVAAAISLAGAILGFTLPLASVVINSVSPLDMAVWVVVALVVQLAVYWLFDLVLLRGISRRIEQNDVAAGITLAAVSLALGMINAASMTY